jgi:hypothetical protein
VTRSLCIGYHGHCFDGMCSAAVLSRVLRELEGTALHVTCRGLEHGPGGSRVPEEILSGDINAVVDYRYTMSARLDWWFDHHLSGIAGDVERAHFDADQSGRKFFDPQYGSCCKLVADVARTRFGIALPDLEDTITWADTIDAARFRDAATVVELRAPALQLMTVIEFHGDEAFMASRIDGLARGATLAELAGDPALRALYAPLQTQHEATIELIARVAHCERGVVTFDLVGNGSDRYNKFIPYYLFPTARYAVAVSASPSRAKVSVGSNPWSPSEQPLNIAQICERYGGGGHRAVGAISLAPGAIDRAREIGAAIAAELRTAVELTGDPV